MSLEHETGPELELAIEAETRAPKEKMRKNLLFSLKLTSSFFFSRRLRYALVGALIFYLYIIYNKQQNETRSATEQSDPTRFKFLESEQEKIYWDVEIKLRNLLENLEHRIDYIASRVRGTKHDFNFNHNFHRLNEPLDALAASRKKSTKVLIRAVEQLFAFNKFKEFRLKAISGQIMDKVDRLQNTKCHLDQVLACSLEDNCGFGCLFHHLTVCFMLSYYMERTVVIAKTERKGIDKFDEVFQSVTNSCTFNHKEMSEIKRQAIRPLELIKQWSHGIRAYDKFMKDIDGISRYHREPVGYMVAIFLSYILRYKPDSSVYQSLRLAEEALNITHPYVGIHIRHSDKFDEAVFFNMEDYMVYADDFYERYFQDNPSKINRTQRTVFMASDDWLVFNRIRGQSNGYRVVYNDTFVNMASSRTERYSREGFESLLFDLYFLSRADYLVCTFSSNICRLAYEMKLITTNDTDNFARSLDVPYFHVNDARLYKMAVLNGGTGPNEASLRKGDLIMRLVSSGLTYEEYRSNGYYYGCNARTKECTEYPSYKLVNFYKTR